MWIKQVTMILMEQNWQNQQTNALTRKEQARNNMTICCEMTLLERLSRDMI